MLLLPMSLFGPVFFKKKKKKIFAFFIFLFRPENTNENHRISPYRNKNSGLKAETHRLA